MSTPLNHRVLQSLSWASFGGGGRHCATKVLWLSDRQTWKVIANQDLVPIILQCSHPKPFSGYLGQQEIFPFELLHAHLDYISSTLKSTFNPIVCTFPDENIIPWVPPYQEQSHSILASSVCLWGSWYTYALLDSISWTILIFWFKIWERTNNELNIKIDCLHLYISLSFILHSLLSTYKLQNNRV